MKKVLIISLVTGLSLIVVAFVVVIIVARQNAQSGNNGPYMPESIDTGVNVAVHLGEPGASEYLCGGYMSRIRPLSCDAPMNSSICINTGITSFYVDDVSVKMPNGEIEKLHDPVCYSPISFGENEFILSVTSSSFDDYEVPLTINGINE